MPRCVFSRYFRWYLVVLLIPVGSFHGWLHNSELSLFLVMTSTLAAPIGGTYSVIYFIYVSEPITEMDEY